MNWINVTKNRWVTSEIPKGEVCTPRIERLDDRTFYCYRNNLLLGKAENLAQAQKKCSIDDQKSRRLHEKVRLWELEHPGELPPFIDLSPAEVKAWERHNPVRRAAPPPKAAGSRSTEKVDLELPPEATMQRARDGNPKKEGSSAHKRWALMFTHCERSSTVSEFLAAGGNAETLRNAVLKGYARLIRK